MLGLLVWKRVAVLAAVVVTALFAADEKMLNVAVLEITGSSKDFTREELEAITSRFETELGKTGKMINVENGQNGPHNGLLIGKMNV